MYIDTYMYPFTVLCATSHVSLDMCDMKWAFICVKWLARNRMICARNDVFVHVLFSRWYFTFSWLVSFVHASFLTGLPCHTISFFCLTVTCSPSSPSPTCPCILVVPTLDLSHTDTFSDSLSLFSYKCLSFICRTYSNTHTHTHRSVSAARICRHRCRICRHRCVLKTSTRPAWQRANVLLWCKMRIARRIHSRYTSS